MAMETLLVHEKSGRPSPPTVVAQALSEQGGGASWVSPNLTDPVGDQGGDQGRLVTRVFRPHPFRKVVSGIEEAMSHIATYGSSHTEAIVTSN